jgi:SAM-dependent methyltransferase
MNPGLTRRQIEEAMAEVVAKHGPWTAHNVALGAGEFTYGEDKPYRKLQRLVQAAADVCGRPLGELRVLDLACLEGGFAIEFARHGATVLGIEGRQANLAKAIFARDILELDRLTFELGDVRDLSAARHGTFDVVICAGILYHLDAPDVFAFAERVAEVCSRVAIIDTSISLRPAESRDYKGRTYWGRSFPEHDDDASTDARAANLWGSLSDSSSFWITRASLLNLLRDAGFTSVMEVLNPALPGQLSDRTVLAAIKGSRQTIHATPSTNAVPFCDWSEHERPGHDPMQRTTYRLEKRLTHMVPVGVRKAIKGVLRSLGLRRSGSAPWEWPVPWKRR